MCKACRRATRRAPGPHALMASLCIWALCFGHLVEARCADIGEIQQAAAEGDYGLALELANKTLEDDPGNPALLALKRDMLWEMGQIDAALHLAERLMQQDEARLPEHRRFVLKCRLVLGRPPFVLKLYEGDRQAAKADLGLVLGELQEECRTEQQRRELRAQGKAVATELQIPAAEIVNTQARQYGDLAQVSQALKARPDDLGLLIQKRDILAQMGEMNAAWELSESLAQRDETHRDEHRRLALEYALRAGQSVSLVRLYEGDLEAAARDMEALLPSLLYAAETREQANELRLAVGRHLLHLSRMDLAWAALYGLVDASRFRGWYPKARLELERFLEQAAARKDPLVTQHFERLIEEASTEREQNWARVWFAQYLAKCSRPHEALALWESVLRSGTGRQRNMAFRSAGKGIGERVEVRGGLMDQLCQRLIASAETEAERNTFRIEFGDYFLGHFWPERGERLLREVLETGDEDQKRRAGGPLCDLSDAYASKAWAYFRGDSQLGSDRKEVAIAAQEKAIALSKAVRFDRLARLGLMYRETGRPGAAVAQYEQALGMAPRGEGEHECRIGLARSLAATGQDSLAEWHFIRAVARSADGGQSSGALRRYGDFLMERGRIEECLPGGRVLKQLKPLLPIERLAEDLAEVTAEDGYPESVQRMALHSRRFLEGTTDDERVDALLPLAVAWVEARIWFSPEAAFSRAYELSADLARKDRVLSEAVRLLGSRQYSALSGIMAEPHKDSFVRPWSMIGPFERPGRGEKLPPETEIACEKAYAGKQGQVRWIKPGPSRPIRTSMRKALGGCRDAVAFALTYVRSPRSQAGQARICSPGPITVWWNDQPIVAEGGPMPPGVRPEEHIADVRLEEGLNKILIKQPAYRADTYFYFRLCDKEGSVLPSVQVSPEPR